MCGKKNADIDEKKKIHLKCMYEIKIRLLGKMNIY